VHAGLGAQQAVGVVALDLDGGAANARHVALGLFEHLGLEALALAVLEVLAHEHLRPVAGLGAAGAGLDVDEAVGWVGRVVEHPAELELPDDGLELGRIGLDGGERREIAFVLGHLVQLGVVGKVARQVVDGLDHGVQAALLAAQFLCPLGVVPDARILERGVDFVQPQCLAVVVKDTPVARRCARSGLRWCRRWR